MGTIADKLTYLGQTKADIRDAIIAKNVAVPVETTFRDYATKISEIDDPQSTFDFAERVSQDGGSVENLTNVMPFLNEPNSKVLAMLPSGKKATKLYNQIPNNADFTVDRNSPVYANNKDGILAETPANVPCFEWEGGKPHLLRQPQATNLLLWSEEFDNSIWAPRVTETGLVAPDGNNTAERINITLAQNNTRQTYTNTINIGDTFTFSIYLKSGFTSKVKLGISRVGAGVYEEAETNEIILTNEWKRYYITYTFLNAQTALNVLIKQSTDDPIDILVWGAQLEQGSTATSYIPTNGTQVTRLEDNISVTTPSGVTSITETIDNVEQTPITVIPATYQIPNGKINKIVMT